MYNNMKVVMVGNDQIEIDEKRPARPIYEVKQAKNDKGTKIKNMFTIIVLHPNKDPETQENKVLYNENHRCEDYFEALDKAKEIIETKFADLETEYEEIKFIPKPATGKKKLRTQDGGEFEDDENNVHEVKSSKKISKQKATRKKVTKKKVSRKKTSKKTNKKSSKKKATKKVVKKTAKKKATKKKVSRKKVSKKTTNNTVNQKNNVKKSKKKGKKSS